MPELSVADVHEFLRSHPTYAQLMRAFALQQFWTNAYLSPEYVCPDEWAAAVVPSESGAIVLAGSVAGDNGSTTPDRHAALFGLFFYNNLLVDIGSTDLEPIQRALAAGARSGMLRWPYIFGRELYDKFNDSVALDRIDTLDATTAWRLLEGTTPGVYQVDTLVSGPLGFLTSAESRQVPPVLRLPLWHCSDTGCGATHEVKLVQPAVPASSARLQLEQAAERRFGTRTPWTHAFRTSLQKPRWPYGRRYYDLGAFMANGLSGAERRAVLRILLESDDGARIRSVLSESGRLPGAEKASARTVLHAIGDAEGLQCLLLVPDDTLIAGVDRAIFTGDLVLQPATTRRAMRRPSPLRYNDTSTEASQLGIRTQSEHPLTRLERTVWKAYSDAGVIDDLMWRLVKKMEAPSTGALTEFIRKKGPERAVAELILGSAAVTRAVAEELRLSMPYIQDEETAVARILWKFGFAVPRYADKYARLRKRLTLFTDTLREIRSVRDEDDRERIRSAGVNCFVSLEVFIEELVAFNVWLLSGDHFAATRWTYRRSEAMASVVRNLGAEVVAGGASLVWRTNGENALGTLLGYLATAREWVNGLGKRSREGLKRPEAELPHYAEDPGRIFPFRHRALWADAAGPELVSYAEGFADIAGRLLRADLAAVRNGLDHWRDADGFPKREAMLACCERVGEAMERAEQRRYVPLELWVNRVRSDMFEREEYELLDYRGQRVVLRGPSSVSSLLPLEVNQPVVVPAGNLLGQPNSEIRLILADEDGYASYWAGYPRRRRIVASEDGTIGSGEPKVEEEGRATTGKVGGVEELGSSAQN